MSNAGNSNRITREYLDSLLIETRYMNACVPDTTAMLYGEMFPSPIMTAALSHLDHFMFPGAAMALAEGAKAAGAVMWYGMAEEEEIARLSDTGVRMIEIIKPYADRELIFKKLRHAERLGLLAAGIDIDHPFAENGGLDVVDGHPMARLTSRELAQIARSARIPLIAKGVLSVADMRDCYYTDGGEYVPLGGVVLSHHNNRIEYAIPPLAILPDILAFCDGEVSADSRIFVDCEIRTGMDAFKALALGAHGVCIGRPLMTAIKENGADGVRDYLLKCNDQLAKAMAFTGCSDLSRINEALIHRLPARGFGLEQV